jgi:uncharacterized protein (DUF1810 family)
LAATAPGPTRDSIINVDCAGVNHQLKQENDLDMFADMDALNIFSSITKIHEDDSKEQPFDPFSFSDYL